ncbi:Zinc phosphodiesterase ELAC protein 2, partial [Cladochytrium tenue]
MLEATGLATFQTMQVEHCPFAYALVMTHKAGWKIVFSGDCRPSEALIEHGRLADVLIHEATFEDDLAHEAQYRRHSTVSQAADVARKMGARCVVLTHFSQRYPRISQGVLELCRRGVGAAKEAAAGAKTDGGEGVRAEAAADVLEEAGEGGNMDVEEGQDAKSDARDAGADGAGSSRKLAVPPGVFGGGGELSNDNNNNDEGVLLTTASEESVEGDMGGDGEGDAQRGSAAVTKAEGSGEMEGVQEAAAALESKEDGEGATDAEAAGNKLEKVDQEATTVNGDGGAQKAPAPPATEAAPFPPPLMGIAFDLMSFRLSQAARLPLYVPALAELYPAEGPSKDLDEADESELLRLSSGDGDTA